MDFGTELLVLFGISLGVNFIAVFKPRVKNAIVWLALSFAIGLLATTTAMLAQSALIVAEVATAAINVILVVFLTIFEVSGSTKKPRIIALFLIFIVLVVPITWNWGLNVGVNNANYLNGLLTYKPESQFFTESLPIGAIPILSEPYAAALAQSHMAADFGGSMQIVDSEQIIYQSQPYWAFTIASTNTWSANYEQGFILVNAINSSYIELKQHTSAGPGLCGWCLSSIDIQSWFKDTTLGIGNWYPQPVAGANGQLTVYYVITRDAPQLSGETRLAGGMIYNPDGTIKTTYQGLSAPSYVNQPWDREQLTQLASDWGQTRTGNNTFNWLAGGFGPFAAASPYRLNLAPVGSANYELIPYHNATALLLFFSPANSERALSGVMLATGSHIYFYDLSAYNYVSPQYAQTQIQSLQPALSGGTLFTSTPILYPLSGIYSYIIPTFFQESGTGTVLFKGIGIVDAKNPNHEVYVAGTDPVATRDSAISQFLTSSGITNSTIGTQGTSTKLTGQVQKATSYEQGGNTIIALQIGGKWYSANPNNIPLDQWYLLSKVVEGQTVTLHVQGSIIVGFDG